MEEERGAHSIWSEHHRVVRRIGRRSLPRRIVGAAASFFVCSARESMIEVVRASSSARSRKSSEKSQRRRRDQRTPSSSLGIPAPVTASRPHGRRRMQHSTHRPLPAASQLPLKGARHVKPPVFAAAQIFLRRLRLRRVRRRGSEQR